MKAIKFLLIITMISTMLSCNSQGVTKKSLENELDSVSYALGLDIAHNFKMNFDNIDKDIFIQGFNNGIDSSNILIDQTKIELILSTFFQKQQMEARQKQQEEAARIR